MNINKKELLENIKKNKTAYFLEKTIFPAIRWMWNEEKQQEIPTNSTRTVNMIHIETNGYYKINRDTYKTIKNTGVREVINDLR